MAKAIMIQGTMSNAGKSLLCAGLCRVFRQDGYKVAPFKSQNMALNSFITREGLEMGRAQVVQAEAAGVEPSVLMNPILLKPVTNMGSQLIVCGEVRGNYEAGEYFKMKHTLVPEIMEAYEKLAAENDIIVIEGAGSPAEINLAKGDFANMGMAKLAKAPVLLVGDIDRGGVFAQLYGTVKLLPQDEQDIIKALIINKFRGDVSLLGEGLDMIKDLTGKPVAGVVPMLDVDIEDEDSLSQRLVADDTDAVLDIVVIRLPKISNFTDLAPLEATPGVGVRYITDASELGEPDLIVIPGTKSTIADLKWMRGNGIETAIKASVHAGTPLIGICGGYQMLGHTITDSEGSEGGGTIEGMGLLPTDTEFETAKHRTRVSGSFNMPHGPLNSLHDGRVTGYEIHMGKTTLRSGANALLTLDNGQPDGCYQDNVYGSYLHGFFDVRTVRESIFHDLAARKGVDLDLPSFDWTEYKEQQYDLLADGVRQALDMDQIYRILEEGLGNVEYVDPAETITELAE